MYTVQFVYIPTSRARTLNKLLNFLSGVITILKILFEYIEAAITLSFIVFDVKQHLKNIMDWVYVKLAGYEFFTIKLVVQTFGRHSSFVLSRCPQFYIQVKEKNLKFKNVSEITKKHKINKINEKLKCLPAHKMIVT